MKNLSQEMWFGYIPEEFPNSAEAPAFSTLYEKLADAIWSVDEEVYGFQDPWFFGLSNDERKCTFCSGTIATGSTFEQVSHVIPEGLGNKRLLSYEECDSCNETYSKYENELVRALSAERVFVGARGKNGPTDKVLAENLHAESKGVGRPIRLSIDMTKGNPIIDSGSKQMTIPVQNISYRPISAIRSILRAAWMVINENQRAQRAPLKDYAIGQITPAEFEFFKVFSPGAPTAMGRLMVWGLKSSADTAKWPQSIVTLSLFNTTLIWRQPIDQQHVRSPIPPFPSYDKVAAPMIQKFTVSSDDAFDEPYTLDISYEMRVAGPPADEKNPKRKSNESIASMKVTVPIEIGIGIDHTASNFSWIPADRTIRAIRGDFEGYSQTKFFSEKHGVKLWVRYQPIANSHKIEINYSGKGLEPRDALIGLDFLQKFAKTEKEQKLFLKQGSDVTPLSLAGDLGDLSLSSEQLNRMQTSLQMIVDIADKVGVPIRVPDPIAADQVTMLEILHTAIKGSGVVRVSIPNEDEFIIPTELANQMIDIKTTATLRLNIVYPYAGIDELNEENLGPIQLHFEISKAEILSSDGDLTTVRMRSPGRIYRFDKFLKAER